MEKFSCKCGKTFKNQAGLSSHQNYCDGSGLVSEQPTELICKYCGKSDFETPQQLGAHVRWCENGPERDKSKLFSVSSEKRKEINRKINKDPDKIQKTAKTLSEKYSGVGFGLNDPNILEQKKEQWRQDHLEAVRDSSEMGGYRKKAGISKGCWYESSVAGNVWLDSSYELSFAKWLDENDVKWERNTERFGYTHNGEEKKYIPDFYLTNENKYIEVKGFETEKDRAKWTDFPQDLEVLKKEDLLNLGCDV